MHYTNEKQPRLDTGNEIKADELILNARLQLYRLSEELIKWQVALYDRDRSLHEKLGKDFNRATLGFYELDEALSSILHKDLEHKIIFCQDWIFFKILQNKYLKICVIWNFTVSLYR